MATQKENGCQYRPSGDDTGPYCWEPKPNPKNENKKTNKGNWKCNQKYHWVDDNEKRAEDWMPKKIIQWLIIAESPPCPTNHDEPPYIYRITDQDEERPILEALVSAFSRASGNPREFANKEDKLKFLRDENGAFLMDLCGYPLNRLEGPLRRKSRKNAEDDLSRRLRALASKYDRKTENIVIVGVTWRRNALAAIDKTDLKDFVRNREREKKIPFPSSRRQKKGSETYSEICIKRLSKVITSVQKAGINDS